MKNYIIHNQNTNTNLYKNNGNNESGKKSKKTLPEVNKKVSLRRHGYRVKKSKLSRHKSLNKASIKYGTLPVLRRLNLIRNYSKKNKEKYQTFSKDVDYMKKKYAHEKDTGTVKLPRKKRTKKTKKTKKTRKTKNTRTTRKTRTNSKK